MTIGIFSIRKKPVEVSLSALHQHLSQQLERQDGRCGCCRVAVPKGVGAAFRDSDGTNLSPDNLVAVCKVCEALHNGGRRSITVDPGWLIYMPELSQIELIRMLYAQKSIVMKHPEHAATLSRIQSEMRTLREMAEKMIGFSDSDSLATMLGAMKPKAYEFRERSLGGIRWAPNLNSEDFTDMSIESSFLTSEELTAFNRNKASGDEAGDSNGEE